MADYRALREEAHESHEARQRRFGGGVSDDKEDKAIAARAVHRHEKHDHKGEPLTKLKRGGDVEGRAAGGRRLDRKGKKGHTTVNIVMGGGGQANPQEVQQAHQAGMQQGAMVGAKMAAAKLAGAGGAPGGASGPPPGMVPPGAGPMPPGAGMPPPQGGPPMIPGRKRGGKAPGESMKFGAGSGEGRLEKEELAEQETGTRRARGGRADGGAAETPVYTANKTSRRMYHSGDGPDTEEQENPPPERARGGMSR